MNDQNATQDNTYYSA